MASFAHALLPFLIAAVAGLSPAPATCYVNPGGNLHLQEQDDQGNAMLRPISFLPTSLTDSGEPRLVHSYTEAFTGFAARLTDAELDAVARKPGFVRAFPDRTLQLTTTHTPEFLGLRQGPGFWRDGAGYGKGAIFGLLDVGIYGAHPSFADHGLAPPPPKWKGTCAGSASRCNSKLIGVKSLERRNCIYRGEERKVVAGKIVICEAVNNLLPYNTSEKSILRDIKSAGAAGVVLINTKADGCTTVLYDYGSDVVQLTAADGAKVTKYAASSPSNSATAVRFNHRTVLGVRPSPTVASFSSRGPSTITPGVLKPDVLAPGLNILAAYPPKTLLGAGPFDVLSGTSMSTPHISGVVALIKSVHPDWSAAAIKSAIMTTSDAIDRNGGPILDEQHRNANAYATGAGHVNPARATDPGLVYDLGAADYASYICALLGEAALAVIARDSSLSCAKLPKTPEAELNYPTIKVPLHPAPFTVTRTVTNVGPAASTYTAKVVAPKSLTVRVSPGKLVFTKAGEEKTFSVTVSGQGGDVLEGSLSWVSGQHVVRSPIIAAAGRRPER
ncbi:subtilisin-like protease [Panicum miliaceum]|uniref:Subtilisin-like protease n=1 Tax=Panicum miliaceum TaxID=4540 RepID=A0A3L6QQQ9_PANMI|nr:subtilisin-like protease [Panicum miliaceum]